MAAVLVAALLVFAPLIKDFTLTIYGREMYRKQVVCLDRQETTHEKCNYWKGARP